MWSINKSSVGIPILHQVLPFTLASKILAIRVEVVPFPLVPDTPIIFLLGPYPEKLIGDSRYFRQNSFRVGFDDVSGVDRRAADNKVKLIQAMQVFQS